MIMSAPGLPDCAGVAQSDGSARRCSVFRGGGILARENWRSSMNLKLFWDF